jgi:peptidoglycan-associated lipoprotein
MIDRSTQIMILVVVLAASTLANCSPRPAKIPQSAPAPGGLTAEQPAESQPTEPVPVAVPPAEPPAPRVLPRAAEFTDHADLRDVYFGPSRIEIGREGARTLEAVARWLQTNEGYLLLIEGHSDAQGSREANFAIAERRAKAALNYLVKLGVLPTRILIVSYGADRPVCPEKTEVCLAKNRRVRFLVKGP